MKNIFPILKLTENKTLVERKRDDGSVIEYIICDRLKQVEDGEPNEYEWSHGMYSFTLEGILKIAALRCFEPVTKFAVIEADAYKEIREDVFDDYDKAHEAMESRYKELLPQSSYHTYSASIFEEEALVEYKNGNWVSLKLIEIRVE